MIEIVNAIKDVIARHIVCQTPLIQDAHTGDTLIKVISTQHFPPSTQIALYNGDPCTANKIDILTVVRQVDSQWLEFSPPISSDYHASEFGEYGIVFDGMIQPLFCGQTIQFVLVGNPPVIPRYPAITVELVGNENAPLTLGTFSQAHRLAITVWASAATYEDSYRLRATLAQKIESALFRTVFPVVEPYCWAYLAEPLPAGQTWAVVDDPSAFSYPYEEQPLPVYLENWAYRYPNSFLSQMDDTTFQLERAAAIDMDTDCRVIRPRIHVYDAFVESIDYGTGNQGELLLLHATMNYSLTIARVRYQEPYQSV